MKTYSFVRALDYYTPWVAARPAVWDLIEQRPMGLDIEPAHRFDPTTLDSGPFLGFTHTLHNLVCGPFGAPMARWVGYDCGLLPGVYFGFGVPTQKMNWALRAGLNVPDDYNGLVPYSIGIAIPMPDRQSWELISVGSLNQVAPGAGPAGLTRLTLAFGTALLGDQEIWSVTRWRSELVGLFAGLGPLEVVTAWTPAHDYPTTVTFKFTPNEMGRERLLRGARIDRESVSTWMDADDTVAMQQLQSDIEEGATVYVLGRAEDRGTDVRYPLLIEDKLEQLHFGGAEPLEQGGEVEEKGGEHA